MTSMNQLCVRAALLLSFALVPASCGRETKEGGAWLPRGEYPAVLSFRMQSDVLTVVFLDLNDGDLELALGPPCAVDGHEHLQLQAADIEEGRRLFTPEQVLHYQEVSDSLGIEAVDEDGEELKDGRGAVRIEDPPDSTLPDDTEPPVATCDPRAQSPDGFSVGVIQGDQAPDGASNASTLFPVTGTSDDAVNRMLDYLDSLVANYWP